MKICIVGGGNIGTAMAVEFAYNNHSVNMLTSRPNDWNETVSAVDSNGEIIYSSKLNLITDDFQKATNSVDYIFVTLPSNVLSSFAEKIAQFVSSEMKFVMIPGFGGSEFLMQPVSKMGGVFGFQRVHAIARIKEYGHKVWFDKKSSAIQFAALNQNAELNKIVDDMKNLFSMDCELLTNYLCITLTPSNPVLHTSRLYSMFKNFTEPFKENQLFYATWDNQSSEILFKLDDEVQMICESLTKIDLSSVVSLKKYYESDSVEAITNKIRSIKSLSKILSPMKKTFDGWIPDFNDRYFVCDFGYGLNILYQLAQILKLNVPMMNEIIDWYKTISNLKLISLSDYGLHTKEDIYDYYLQRR